MLLCTRWTWERYRDLVYKGWTH